MGQHIMKKFISYCLSVLFCIAGMTANVSAQSLSDPSMTYFKPFTMPKVTTEYVTDRVVGSGLIFTGTVYYSDGRLTSYSGCLKNSNGDEFHGNFNPSFGVNNGEYSLYIPASRDVAYLRVVNNGQFQVTRQYDIQGRSFYISGTALHYADENTGGGNYYGGSYGGGSYSGGSSSSSGSSYNSHEAICRGCNGTGRCQHCGGTGWMNNHSYKCSLCHGNGTCRSCAGVGKKYGNY